MNGGEMMTVMIVAIVMVARVVRVRGGWGRFGFRGGCQDDGWRGDGRQGGNVAPQDEAENRRLREEVRALRDRIAVLERIATDSSTHLDREIEALRDRPSSRERL